MRSDVKLTVTVDMDRAARIICALSEALPKLRREHGPIAALGAFTDPCPAADSFDRSCRCGADEHNAILDELTKILEGH